ncbi:MAG: prephenate dehydrogenase [Candidatus Micrarchaeota archaeon]
MRIGIIGFGAFGRLAASILARKFEVTASDERDLSSSAEAIGVAWGSLEEASACKVVLLCVPASRLEALMHQIGRHLTSGSLLLDTCSVKEVPCKLLSRLAPAGVEVIGTHPLFGPKSTGEGIKGRQVVICPLRANPATVAKTTSVLKSLGLNVMAMTPTEHDRTMARTQALAHFIAQGLDARSSLLRVESFDKLSAAADLVRGDSAELFLDIETLNRFARRERQKFMAKLGKMEVMLDGEKS